MEKQERDNLMTRLTPEERNTMRQLIVDTTEEWKFRAPEIFTAQKGLEPRKQGLSPQLQAALDAVIARDEMGPAVGQEPPDFNLKLLGTEERVSLSDYRGKSPVALVFGSYT